MSPATPAVLVVIAALAAATFVAGRVIVALAAPEPPAVTGLATLGGMSAQVGKAEWTGMDHDMSADAPGYQMPPAMMPGMPAAGEQRLAVSVTLVNTTDETLPLRPSEEFVLRAAKNDQHWSPHSHNFSDVSRLAPHNAINGVLFFDLPPTDLADSARWLEWSHDGTAARLMLPLDGATPGPEHPHNP